jgi:universal stress protein A
MTAVKRLLVPTDFSPASSAAVRYAIDLATDLGATIHMLHVIEEWDMTARHLEALSIELPGLRERVIADAADRLRTVAAGLGAALPIATEVREGRPADIIVDVARAKAIDLIVMGTHGRTGLSHALLGSVAERVLRTAPCAVLTVRAASGHDGERAALAAESRSLTA